MTVLTSDLLGVALAHEGIELPEAMLDRIAGHLRIALGLADDPESVQDLIDMAKSDRVRGWSLTAEQIDTLLGPKR